MSAPGDCFTIYHGKLKINVPYSLFDSMNAEVDQERLEQFRRTLMTRYPWISENAVRVIVNNARKEMLRIIDERRRNAGMRKMDPVDITPEAITEARRNVERNPQDYDAWMRLGELLCRDGDMEEGYRAINKARSLLK